MPIPFLDLLVLLGALQGFILAILLWFSRKGSPVSNRLLAGLILLLGLASLAVGIPNTNWQVSLFLDLAPLIMVMPMGPLLYFYTRSVLDPTFHVGREEQRHFYPVVLDWGAKGMGCVFVAGRLLGAFEQRQGPVWGRIMDEYNAYVDVPRWVSLTVYVLLSARLLRRHHALTQSYTTEPPQTLPWLRQFLAVFSGFQLLWLIYLVPYIIPASRDFMLDRLGWYPIYIPIAILIYWLGLKGYLQSRSQPVGPTARKVRATPLPAETIAKTVGRLKTAMQADKLYLDPELTVEKVGRHVQLPAKTISFVLNQHLQKSFNAFINEYRIEAVKQGLTDSANGHLTLTGIAFDCGFNSQATFQRTFKQMTGLSPKTYRNHRVMS